MCNFENALYQVVRPLYYLAIPLIPLTSKLSVYLWKSMLFMKGSHMYTYCMARAREDFDSACMTSNPKRPLASSVVTIEWVVSYHCDDI